MTPQALIPAFLFLGLLGFLGSMVLVVVLAAQGLSAVNRLSQAHVLQQIDHLRSYPSVAERVADGAVTLHAWWFDLANAEVLAFDGRSGAFVPVVDLPV